jgi:O-antigen/teichoic acid export membrane protein
MNNNKKIALNSAIIFIRLLVSSIISIIVSRIVLDALGVTDYGLYNVVGGIVIMLNVFNGAMASTTYRYIAFELGKGTIGQPNKVFSISLAIHICFVIFIIIIGATIGELYINNYLNVTAVKLSDAKFVFRVSIVTASLATLFTPYQGLLVAYEKFSTSAIFEISIQLAKLAAIICLLQIFQNRIRMYSLIMLGTTFLSCLLYFIYCARHYMSIIKFRIYKDFKLYKEMISFASWTLFGAVANVGKTQGSAIIINLFFGTFINAAFAIASQVENFILTFARTLNNAAIPQITKNFSGGDIDRSVKITSYISKYTFLLMSLVAFPVVLEMDFLLNLWLIDVPKGTAAFSQLMILGALLGSLGEGIPALVNATGKIKIYQIVVNTIILIGLPITYFLYKSGFTPVTILIVYCIISGLNGFVKLYLLYRIIEFDLILFIKTSYLKILFVSIPLVIFYLFYNPSNFSFADHFIGLFFSEIFLFSVVFIFGSDKKERDIIKRAIYRLVK